MSETTLAQTTPVQRERAPGGGGRRPARRRWLPYALLLPAIVLELLVHVVPMAVGVWISFVQLTQAFLRRWSEAPFVGLDNYAIALDFDSTVGQSLLNSFAVTCGFTLLVVAVSWGLGMAGAVALQRSFPGRGLFRTIFLLPYALPIYAGVITWKFMLQKDNGALNGFVYDILGIEGDKPFWLLGDNAFWAVTVVAIWRMWPFAFLMLMAGLQSIPADVYEAAAVDGARPFRQWRSLTLPMLRPVNVVLVLVMFLWTFNDFNTPFVLFGKNAQPPAGDLISFHIYNSSFVTWNFGYGSAMSVLLLLFLLAVTAVYLLFVNRRSARA